LDHATRVLVVHWWCTGTRGYRRVTGVDQQPALSSVGVEAQGLGLSDPEVSGSDH